MTDREIAAKIAWSYLGVPYRWGGDDPMAGFDCSGLVIEILKSVGRLPQKGDWSASQLRNHYEHKTIIETDLNESCLVFFTNKLGSINHVGFCINDKMMIEAGGGDSNNTTTDQAILDNAFVRVRPIKVGRNIHSYVDPFRD